MHAPHANDITVTTPEKAYQITFWRGIAIVAGACLVTFVSTAFAFFSTANADHFQLLRHSERIEALESGSVQKDVLTEKLKPMESDIKEIKSDIKELLKQERNK